MPHDTEFYLITGAPFMDSKLYPSNYILDEAKWTEADRNLSYFFMASWANFAKTGYEEVLLFKVCFHYSEIQSFTNFVKKEKIRKIPQEFKTLCRN